MHNLKNNEEVLLGMVLADKDIDPVRKELNKHMEEVKKLACKLSSFKYVVESNLTQKQELDQLNEQHEIKYTQYISLKSELESLLQQEQQIMNVSTE